MPRVSIRVNRPLLDDVEGLVEADVYDNRSEAMRALMDTGLEHRKQTDPLAEVDQLVESGEYRSRTHAILELLNVGLAHRDEMSPAE